MSVNARREVVLDGAMTVLVASVSDVFGSWEFFIVDSTHGHPDFCQVRDSYLRPRCWQSGRGCSPRTVALRGS